MNAISDEIKKAIIQEKIDLLKSIPIQSRELYPGKYFDQIDKVDVDKMVSDLKDELYKLSKPF